MMKIKGTAGIIVLCITILGCSTNPPVAKTQGVNAYQLNKILEEKEKQDSKQIVGRWKQLGYTGRVISGGNPNHKISIVKVFSANGKGADYTDGKLCATFNYFVSKSAYRTSLYINNIKDSGKIFCSGYSGIKRMAFKLDAIGTNTIYTTIAYGGVIGYKTQWQRF